MSEQKNGRSVAIWGEAKDTSERLHEETLLNVHLNYWHIRSQKAKADGAQNFLDVGIMVYGPAQLSHLCLYVPFDVSIADLEDLGPRFAQSLVASIVFNENLRTESYHKSNFIELLHDHDGSLHSRVYRFAKGQNEAPSQNEMALVQEENGTIIKICQSALSKGSADLPAGRPLYFRIRVRVAEKQGARFIRTIKPVDAWLLSSFDNTEFLDFRLNEARNLPDGIMHKMSPAATNNAQVPITRVDFLVIVGEAAEVADGVECNKKRLLESELWDTYTKSKVGCKDGLSDGMVIYHWKKTTPNFSDIGDFSAFIKLKLRRSGFSLVCRYLFVIAIIGCLGSLIASVVWTRFGMEEFVKPKEHLAEVEKSQLRCTGEDGAIISANNSTLEPTQSSAIKKSNDIGNALKCDKKESTNG